MISCRDVNNLQMDGMELVAGAAGLDRMVSWTYLVQTKPYKDHMNPGNFALLVVDYKRFSMDEAYDAMVELNELGISGFAISVVEDREETPQRMKDKLMSSNCRCFIYGGRAPPLLILRRASESCF